jgi:hypothetical protein
MSAATRDLSWYDRWVAAKTVEVRDYDQPPDEPPQREPARLTIGDYLLVIARSEPARVRRVPSSAIVEDGTDDSGEFSCVECPCTARPVVRSKLEKCLGCERYYVEIEPGAVYVAYGEMPPPPLS